MKLLLQTIAVAFGMWSAVPVRRVIWNEKNLRYSLLAFPLIGVVLGLLFYGWTALAGVLSLPPLLRAAGYVVLPPLLTGGIHLDGYADTADALASWGEPERKREILKDPHTGAFAVIRLCLYLLTYFTLCTVLSLDGWRAGCVFGATFVLSRCLSGAAVAWFPKASDTGLARTFSDAADRKTVGTVLTLSAALLSAGMIALEPLRGALTVLAALLVFWHYHHMANRQFGGITGDLAGWFLQKAEWWMLFAYVFTPYLQNALTR